MGGESKVREHIKRRALAVWQGSLRVAPRGLLATLAATVVAVTALAVAPAVDAQAQRLLQISGANRTVAVTIAVGKTEDVRVDAPFSDVTVGDPEVADVAPLTDHTLSILGKKIGTTRVTVYADGKRQLGIFDIEVSYDVSRLAAEIRSGVGGAGIRVSSVNGRIMLSGSAPDAATLDKAVTIARQFAPEIINTVRVSAPQQVMLEVRFIEASRQAGRELGIQWNIFNSHLTSNTGSMRSASLLPITAPTSPTNIPAGEVAAGLLSGTSPFGFLLGRVLASGTTIDVLINALEQRGLARSLAEPNLTALSGDTASFLAGGEYPIPVSGTNNSVTVEFKRYGVGLAFTPTVLQGGHINLKIEPEVSQFDVSHSISLGPGLPPIPALIVRRASTTIELRDGQSFVIGGLLQNVSKANQEQVPWLGDVPVLGALFASRSFLKDETDLAIIVTPRLVRPARPGDPIKTPLDDTVPGNDADFFLEGKGELPRGRLRAAMGAEPPNSGHVLDLPRHVLDLPNGGNNVVVSKN
jgi:pilus assembly protein CpaC